MTTAPPTSPALAGPPGRPRPGRRRLGALVAVHLLALLATVYACVAYTPFSRRWGVSLLVGHLVLCWAQACLLGLWAAFSASRPVWRWAMLIGGTVGLGTPTFLLNPWFRALALVAALVAALASAVGLASRRRFGTCLVRTTSPPAFEGRRGPRFSIRGLMVLTLGVALVGGGVRAMRDELPLGDSEWLVAIVLGVAVATPALAAAAAALAPGPVGLRSALALVFAPTVAALTAYGLREDLLNPDRELLVAIAGPTPIVLASLLVVRSAGYRLARRPAADPSPGPPESAEDFDKIL